MRDELEFEIDGMVVKVNDLEARKKLGFALPRSTLGGGVQICTRRDTSQD